MVATVLLLVVALYLSGDKASFGFVSYFQITSTY